jgi:ABC-type oligopeptide transport system ATPase subunit
LVGESGSGKTTVGRMLTRLYEPTSGDILYQGKPLNRDEVTVTSDRSGQPHDPVQVKFYRLAQIIFQNPYSSLKSPQNRARNPDDATQASRYSGSI